MITKTRDDGQAAVVLVMVMAVVFTVSVSALTVLGGRVTDEARAQTAADAVALASLAGGRSLASEVAQRHGAEVVSWTSVGPDGDGVVVRVVVSVGSATAMARATSAP